MIDRKNNNLFFIVLILISGASFLRLYNLSADPPESMDVQFICDEGWWIHNARNHALFGNWIKDDFNQSLLISPTYCVMTRLSYALLGTGFASSRLPAAVSGIGCIILFFAILKRYQIRIAAIASMILLGFNFSFTSLNRIAFIDTTAFFFILLTWLLLESKSLIGTGLGGTAFGLAVVTKSYSLAVLPVILLIFVQSFAGSDRKAVLNLMKRAALFITGICLVLAAYFLFVVHPFQTYFNAMYSLWQSGNIPSSFRQTILNIPATLLDLRGWSFFWQKFFRLNAFLVFLVWNFFLTRTWFKKNNDLVKKSIKLEHYAIISLFIFFAEILPLTAKPFRRFIFLYIPLIILGSLLIDRLWSARHSNSQVKLNTLYERFLFWCPLSVFLSLPLASVLPFQIFNSRGVSAASNAAIGFIILAVPLIAFSRSAYFNRIYIRMIDIRVLICIFILWEGSAFISNYRHTETSLYDASKRLGNSLFAGNPVVLGGLAHTLSLENTIKPVAIWGREGSGKVLNADPVNRFHPKFLVIIRELDGMGWPAENRIEKYADDSRKIETLKLLPTREHRFRVIADIYKMPQETSAP